MDFKYLRNFKWHRYERANKVGNQKFDYGYEGILYRCLPKILFKGNPSITAFLQLIDMRLIMMFKTIDDIKHFKDIHWDPTISDVNKPFEVNPILKERKHYIQFILDDGIDYFIFKGEKYYRDTKFKIRKGTTIEWETICKYGFHTKPRFGSHLVKGDDIIYLRSRRNRYDVNIDYTEEQKKYDVNINYDKQIPSYDVNIDIEKQQDSLRNIFINYEREKEKYDVGINVEKEPREYNVDINLNKEKE